MFRRSKQISEHETRLAALSLAVAELRAERDRSLPAELLKTLEVMQAELDSVRISLRSLHGKVAIEKRHALEAGQSRAADATSDADFEAMVALQRQFTGGH